MLVIAILPAMATFGGAIFWRAQNRVLPKWMLAVEIIIAIIWTICLVTLIGVLIGPSDVYMQ